jgi:rhodanese-related sulfurtransferase
MITPIELSPEDVIALRDAGTPHRLIDCREDDEWHLCRIEGATLIPLSSFADSAPPRLADKAARLIVYCHHGMRSLRAAQWLRHQGYDHAQSLRGGIDLWSELIDPSVPRY